MGKNKELIKQEESEREIRQFFDIIMAGIFLIISLILRVAKLNWISFIFFLLFVLAIIKLKLDGKKR